MHKSVWKMVYILCCCLGFSAVVARAASVDWGDEPRNVIPPLGTCAEFSRIDPSRALPTGPVTGYQWQLVTMPKEVPDTAEKRANLDGVWVTFLVGQAQRDGRGVIIYSTRGFSHGTVAERSEVLLSFDIR